jgi:hypothetical protein
MKSEVFNKIMLLMKDLEESVKWSDFLKLLNDVLEPDEEFRKRLTHLQSFLCTFPITSKHHITSHHQKISFS